MKPEVTFDEGNRHLCYLLHCQDLNLNTIRLLFLNACKFCLLFLLNWTVLDKDLDYRIVQNDHIARSSA